MSKSRTKLAFLNTFTALFYQIVSIVCGLITPRLILYYFGSTYNGVINSATQFLGLISILNLGVAGATRVALYKTLASNDVDGTNYVVNVTKSYYKKVGIVLIAYTILLMIIYPLISHNSLQPYECVLLIGAAGISSFFQFYFGIANATLLTADQRDYVSSILDISTIVIATIVTVVLINANLSIILIQFASAAVFSLKPFFLNLVVKKKYNIKKICSPRNDIVIERKSVAMHSIANIVHDQTDIVILTLFTDAKIISVYGVHYLVVGKIKSLLGTFTKGIEGAFGELYAKREFELLNKVFREYEFSIFSLITVAFSCTGCLLVPFIRLYTSGITDVTYVVPALAILITITEAIFCIRQPYLLLVQAAGCYKETKNGAIFEACLNLVISIVLVKIIGIYGVVIGTLVANLFRTIQYSIFCSKNILNRSYSKIVSLFLFFLLVTLVSVLFSLLVMHFLPISNWLLWIANGFISTAIVCFSLFILSLVFYKQLLISLLKRLKSVFNKRVNL